MGRQAITCVKVRLPFTILYGYPSNPGCVPSPNMEPGEGVIRATVSK